MKEPTNSTPKTFIACTRYELLQQERSHWSCIVFLVLCSCFYKSSCWWQHTLQSPHEVIPFISGHISNSFQPQRGRLMKIANSANKSTEFNSSFNWTTFCLDKSHPHHPHARHQTTPGRSGAPGLRLASVVTISVVVLSKWVVTGSWRDLFLEKVNVLMESFVEALSTHSNQNREAKKYVYNNLIYHEQSHGMVAKHFK